MTNRLLDPLETWALDFKREFPRFKICSVSTTIGINRTISGISSENGVVGLAEKRPSGSPATTWT